MTEQLTVAAALRELDAWTELQDSADRARDAAIARAIEAGVSKMDIHKRTGIARTTIDRVLFKAGVLSPRQADAAAALDELRRKLAGE